MLYTLLFTIVVIAFTSLSSTEGEEDPKGIALEAKLFKTESSFNLASYGIMVILAVLYAVFW